MAFVKRREMYISRSRAACDAAVPLSPLTLFRGPHRFRLEAIRSQRLLRLRKSLNGRDSESASNYPVLLWQPF